MYEQNRNEYYIKETAIQQPAANKNDNYRSSDGLRQLINVLTKCQTVIVQ